MGKQGKNKNIYCPVCGREYYDTGMGAAQLHIQRKHPESHLSPKLRNASIPNDVVDPVATPAYAYQDVDEPADANVNRTLEAGSIVPQLSYSLSGGSPWRILSDSRRRTFHHPEFPWVGPSVMDAEWIQGLPGKTETISNVIVNELDGSAKRTQAIILSPTREAAQTMYTRVSASAVPPAITFHLSIGGTNAHEDRKRLKERPHIVVGTTGRISDMIKRKAIDPSDIEFLCVDGIQQLLGLSHENEFAEFCERLPKNIQFVLLSTKTRYRTPHDFSQLFTREPLYFLVKEDLTPEPGVILRDLEPADVDSNQIEDMPPKRFHCEERDCGRSFSSQSHLMSHMRFFHPADPVQIAEEEKGVAVPSNGLPEAGQRPTERSPMYFSPPNVSSPSSEGAMWWEDLRTLSPPEAPVPILRPEGHQDANSNVGRDVQQVSESSPEPPTTSDANVLSAATVSTPLSLQCRMCNASPTVGSRPVAAMCGHIFCSECITQHVISTSRCPVCDNTLLLYCLFRLDLPLSS